MSILIKAGKSERGGENRFQVLGLEKTRGKKGGAKLTYRVTSLALFKTYGEGRRSSPG